ncbi:hypothetical protein ANCDUO_00521 [Ancylostoma duodenale]|uniref:Uncharacterized protein n=1 Tax=Ancylostoma duodenale TaxID=51022 RepID=A0A0C2DGN0_9BILA|nr:hypothetical protein ANCDUO_00521 [Ancylostoma duodenale]
MEDAAKDNTEGSEPRKKKEVLRCKPVYRPSSCSRRSCSSRLLGNPQLPMEYLIQRPTRTPLVQQWNTNHLDVRTLLEKLRMFDVEAGCVLQLLENNPEHSKRLRQRDILEWREG